MDLNELFYRHQVSVARAAMAGSAEARYAHRGLAAGYARRISHIQTGKSIVELLDGGSE